MAKQEKDPKHRAPDASRVSQGIYHWTTHPEQQRTADGRPKTSFHKDLARINRYIINRLEWNEELYKQAEAIGQEGSIKTLITMLRLGISVEIHKELQKLGNAHEQRKAQTLQRLRNAYRDQPGVQDRIEGVWSMLGLDQRADQSEVVVNRNTLALIERTLLVRLKSKDALALSNAFNDQMYIVKSLGVIFKEGLVEITGKKSARVHDHIQLMEELVQLTEEFSNARLTDEAYNHLLRLCTALFPQDDQAPPASIVSDLYTLSMEFDDHLPSLPNEKTFPSFIQGAFDTGTRVAELLRQIWTNLPFIIAQPDHASFSHLKEFLTTYRRAVHINAYDEGVDYYQQLAIWFVIFDLVSSTLDVALLMDTLERSDDDLSEIAQYFFEYTKHGLQRYPTSPEEAQPMFTPLRSSGEPSMHIIDHAMDELRHIFSETDQLFEVEKNLTFQQLVQAVIRSNDRDYISLADQGFVLSEQLGINGTHHQAQIMFKELDDHTHYQVAVNLSIDQYSSAEEIEEDDLSYRLRFVVTGAYDSNEIVVSCLWRTGHSTELARQIEHRLLLLLTQQLMITHQVGRKHTDSVPLHPSSTPAPQIDHQTPTQERKEPKRKALRRHDETASSPNITPTLRSAVNMAERQKFLPLTLDLTPELRAKINRKLEKDPTVSPYVQLLDFIEIYNQTQGLACTVHSCTVEASPGTFRLRTHNQGVLDDYRFFYEREDGGVGKITKVSYRNSKTYK